jgi:hypothetical protein
MAGIIKQISNYDQIGTLYDTADKLIGVRYSVYDAGLNGQDWIDAIEMRFENDTIATIYVEAEFDTLRLELSEVKLNEDCSIKVATSVKPWADVVGGALAWMWLLTNQQGYEDGFRFEFSSKKEEGKYTIITLLGIASRIEIYLSEKINL